MFLHLTLFRLDCTSLVASSMLRGTYIDIDPHKVAVATVHH